VKTCFIPAIDSRTRLYWTGGRYVLQFYHAVLPD
jgi:hypothetical protein